MRLQPIDYAMGVSVAFVWAMGIVLSKAALEDFPPILLIAFRFTVTALVLLWALRPTGGQLKKLALIALIGSAIQYSLTFNGLEQLDATVAALVVQLEVPFLVLLGAAFLGENPGLRTWLGVAVAFLGVGLISGAPTLGDAWIPLALVIGGAFTWAIGQAMIRTLKALDGVTVTAWVATLAAPQLFLLSAAFERDQLAHIAAADWRIWATIAYLGLVMTAVGYAMWNALLRRNPVSAVAPFLLLLPVFSVAGAAVILKEEPSLQVLLGGGVVLLGLGMIFFQPRTPSPQNHHTD